MAHEQLRALPCYEEMHDRIVAGIPLTVIAKWLQDEKKLLTDKKADSLVRALTRYKGDIPAGELGLIDGALTQARLEEVVKDIDELQVLAKLITLQVARINLAHQTEKTINFANPKLQLDIEATRKLLETSAELKFRLGVYHEAERSVTVNHNVKTAEALDSLTAEERRRAGVLAQNVLTRLPGLLSGIPPQATDVPFELVSSTPLPADPVAAPPSPKSWFEYDAEENS